MEICFIAFIICTHIHAHIQLMSKGLDLVATSQRDSFSDSKNEFLHFGGSDPYVIGESKRIQQNVQRTSQNIIIAYKTLT